ncbi:hypothetical protein SAMD00019534_050610, partial [Acytostelium subglobosum LB1]|uniref:hypothetical protein n=1 Tax=Acytostelium subglobosum LB1 TaxID=1410327 RepID=UPI000644893A
MFRSLLTSTVGHRLLTVSSKLNNTSTLSITAATVAAASSASTVSTIIMPPKQQQKQQLKTKAVLPKMSQCAEALKGNRFYTTKPGYKPEPYLGPPPYLKEIVKLEKLQGETPEAIKEIWLKYHSAKDSICAVIPAETYNKMKLRAKSCPLFVFPLPGDKGYISILYQWQEDTFMYTFLDQYKKYTINAVPWLSAAHYTDLIESKGIVLMRADPNLEVLNTIQAQFLYNQTQMFLLDDKKFNIMQTFTYNPQRFDFNQVLKEIDSQQSMLEGLTDTSKLKEAKVIEPYNPVVQATTTTSTTTASSTVNPSESNPIGEKIHIDTYRAKQTHVTPKTSS